MNSKKSALIMLLWLLCQQAGAVAGAFGLPSALKDVDVTSCHDQPSDRQGLPDLSLNTDLSSDSDLHCCEASCQCAMAGCLSVISHSLDQNAQPFATYSLSYYRFTVQQTVAQSLFRPPISA